MKFLIFIAEKKKSLNNTWARFRNDILLSARHFLVFTRDIAYL